MAKQTTPNITGMKKIFVPTLSCYRWSGDAAITSFADNPWKDDQKPDKQVVVMLKSDFDQLRAYERGDNPEHTRRSIADALGDKNAANEVLSFLAQRLGSQPLTHDTPVEIDEQFYFMLSSADSVEGLIGSLPESARGKLRVVCKYHGEQLDLGLRGLPAEMAEFDKVNPNIRRSGIVTLEDDLLFNEVNESYYSRNSRRILSLNTFGDHVKDFFANQYLIVKQETGKNSPMVGYVVGDVHWNRDHTRFDMGDLEVRLFPAQSLLQQRVFDIAPKDIEQAIFLHTLKQPHISRIFVTGGAGCGKTLVGYASALHQCLGTISREAHQDENAEEESRKRNRKRRSENEKKVWHSAHLAPPRLFVPGRFDRLFITKPTDLIGGERRERGYLPGKEREKLEADIRSYIDAHEKLGIPDGFYQFEQAFHDQKEQPACKEIVDTKLYRPPGPIVMVEDYAHWRGRTLDRAVTILDEAQNLTPAEMKHLNQRIGLGSLVIIAGDYENQRDNPRLSITTNGLFAGILHFRGQPYTAVISLPNSYRDMGAEHAGKMKVLR